MRTKRVKWDNAGESATYEPRASFCATCSQEFGTRRIKLDLCPHSTQSFKGIASNCVHRLETKPPAGDGTAPAAPKPEDLRQKAEAAAARIVAQIKEDKVL